MDIASEKMYNRIVLAAQTSHRDGMVEITKLRGLDDLQMALAVCEIMGYESYIPYLQAEIESEKFIQFCK